MWQQWQTVEMWHTQALIFFAHRGVSSRITGWDLSWTLILVIKCYQYLSEKPWYGCQILNILNFFMGVISEFHGNSQIWCSNDSTISIWAPWFGKKSPLHSLVDWGYQRILGYCIHDYTWMYVYIYTVYIYVYVYVSIILLLGDCIHLIIDCKPWFDSQVQRNHCAAELAEAQSKRLRLFEESPWPAPVLLLGPSMWLLECF